MKTQSVKELILLRGVCLEEASAAFVGAVEEDDPEKYARAYAALLTSGEQNAFAAHLANAILYDDNLFARRAFSGGLNEDILAAYRHDLQILRAVADSTENLPPLLAERVADGLPRIRTGKDNPLFGKDWTSDETIGRITEFYRKNGYGIFIGHKAFTFEKGSLVPVRNTSDVSLSDLKDYEAEKRAVEDNIVNFIEGLPYSNMLLYGDKGTGKSSTVHAMLNKYAERGLRAVEIPKDQIKEINALKETLAPLPFRFMIFIDDLSLEEHDEKVTSLKAGLEGSMNEKSANVMIAATSNRRHILKENFSDRDNSVHASDTLAEQLSLSDRFGLTVLFSSTGKAEYLSIIRQLANDRKLDIAEQELFTLAERWALTKGGRSPRRAKQFVDYIYACKMKNSEIDI